MPENSSTANERPPAHSPPSVSIVVPVYQAEAFLAQCLQSLIEQTFTGIEVIVVNDASTDNSQAIIQDFPARDSRVRFLVNETNEMALESRIRGAELARGKYLLFCDADDYLPHNAVEVLYKAACDAGADIVHGKTRALRAGKTGEVIHNSEPFAVTTGRAYVRTFLGTARGWSLWGKLFSRSAWEKALPLLPRGKKWFLAEDLFASLIIGLQAQRYAGISETVYLYRPPDTNFFANPDRLERRIDDHLDVLAHMRTLTGAGTDYSDIAPEVAFLTRYIIASIFRHLPADDALHSRVKEMIAARLGSDFLRDHAESDGALRTACAIIRKYGLHEAVIVVKRWFASIGKPC